jgi:predicted RNA-binding Zn-ribbon protein involved in translation (DUF1610 family)
MTTIKATCPTCGEVGLRPGDIDLRVDDRGVDDSFYAFTCPTCLDVVRKRADDRIVRLLVSGGVPPKPVRDEHPERPRGGPRLTTDDLIDFHELLESPDWFDQLLRLSSLR